MLTAEAHHDIDSNPEFHGCKSSTLPLSYPSLLICRNQFTTAQSGETAL